MANVSKSASRSVFIASSPQRPMTVWALRDFVRALDAEGIPDTAELSAEHDHNTQHFTGLRVRVTTEIDEPADAESGPPSPPVPPRLPRRFA